MRILPLLFFSITILLSSCNKDEPIESPKSTTHIQFESSEVGQQSIFLGFDANGYGSAESYEDYEYSGDTLWAEITDKIDDYYIVDQSNSINDDRVRFKFKVTDGQVEITKLDESDHYINSALFWIGLNDWGISDTMYLDLSPFTAPTTISGWQITTNNIGNFTNLYCESAEILGQSFTDMNVIVDNIPMQVDGNGKTYIYNSSEGFIRTFTYSPWTLTGIGWDLLKNN